MAESDCPTRILTHHAGDWQSQPAMVASPVRIPGARSIEGNERPRRVGVASVQTSRSCQVPSRRVAFSFVAVESACRTFPQGHSRRVLRAQRPQEADDSEVVGAVLPFSELDPPDDESPGVTELEEVFFGAVVVLVPVDSEGSDLRESLR